MATIGTDITQAKIFLEQGNLIGLPTETVYGLAGNALDVDTVSRIFQVKDRPSFDPLIVHTDSLEKVRTFVKNVPEAAELLARNFWPGPLTLLLPKEASIPDLVTSGMTTVAVRVPRHPVALDLLKVLDFPLAAPSANPFGYISPTTAQHVDHQLGQRIPYILEGGPCQVGIESTIIGFEKNLPIVYRMGGMSIEQLEALIGPMDVKAHSSSDPKAPGMLKSHYAPRKPLILGDIPYLLKEHVDTPVAVLSFREEFPQIAKVRQRVLSKEGDIQKAAAQLFSALRYLDESDAELILAEEVPEEGLGRAINDRLRRAAVE